MKEKSPDKPFWNVITQGGNGYYFEESKWRRECPEESCFRFDKKHGKNYVIFYSPLLVEYISDETA